jgi:hypothetical protein
MLSEYEAARLQRDMRAELDGATGALLKSVVGLLVVVLLALFGAQPDLRNDTAFGEVGAQAAAERRL